MPAQASNRELLRICINVWKDDYEKLRAVAKAKGDIQLATIIRQCIHDYVMRLNDLERRKLDKIAPLDLDLSSAAEGD